MTNAGPQPVREVSPPGTVPLSEVDARYAAQRDQFRHDNTLVPLNPRPGEPVTVWATSGSGLPLGHAAVFYTTDGTEPGPTAAMAPMEIAAVDWDPRGDYLTRWHALLPGQPAGTTVRYRIGAWHPTQAPESNPTVWAQDGQGFWFRFPPAQGITTFAYAVESGGPTVPPWVQDAVIYHIFLDRFHPGTPDGTFTRRAKPQSRHGGTLRGVQQALPYLVDLGVTCLWLSPLCAAETYHRYDATDLYRVDPALGTEDDLRALVAAAHASGMRILLDLVPSHCSWHHPAFMAARHDPSAPTRSWFTFEHWPDSYRTFLGAVPELPSFNTDDPGARAHIIDSAVHWLRAFDVDGFRLDHAISPSMDFWVAFRSATRAVRPDAFTVGEVTDTPDCVRRYRGRLDSILDFELARALRLTFATGQWGVAALDGFLAAYERYMASGPGRVSFLDNHDMTRFLFLADGEARRLTLAALCQFTLDATPTIYYGTEIGLTQRRDFARGGDAEARRDMPWSEQAWDRDLLAFYWRLTRLRTGTRALRYGMRRTVHLDESRGTYAYARYLPDELGQEVLTVINASDHERSVTLSPTLAARSLTCLLSTGVEPDIDTTGDLTVKLAPLTGVALGTA